MASASGGKEREGYPGWCVCVCVISRSTSHALSLPSNETWRLCVTARFLAHPSRRVVGSRAAAATASVLQHQNVDDG